MKRTPWINAKVPEISGCYIFRDGDLVLYVGESININKRLRPGWHQKLYQIEVFFPLATVEFVPCPVSELHQRERELIAKLKPVLHGTTSGFLRGKYFSPVGLHKRHVYDVVARRVSSAYERITKYLNNLELPTN